MKGWGDGPGTDHLSSYHSFTSTNTQTHTLKLFSMSSAPVMNGQPSRIASCCQVAWPGEPASAHCLLQQALLHMKGFKDYSAQHSINTLKEFNMQNKQVIIHGSESSETSTSNRNKAVKDRPRQRV